MNPLGGVATDLFSAPIVAAGQPVLATLLGDRVLSILLGVFALLCLVAAGVILSRSRRMAGPSTTEIAQPGFPPTVPGDEETRPSPPMAERKAVVSSTSAENGHRDLPDEQAAIDAESTGNFPLAASIWRQRHNLAAERAALTHTNETARLAELDLVLGRPSEAIPHLGKLLASAPQDEHVRLNLVNALLDTGKPDDAFQLVEVVIPETAPIPGSAVFLTKAGRAFEAAGNLRRAQMLYRSAASRGIDVEDLSTRLVYLNQMTRLVSAAPPSSNRPDQRELLKVALSDSMNEIDQIEDTPEEQPSTAAIGLTPHSVIVGHLALGGSPIEPPRSVSSLTSIAARFQYNRMVGERASSVVFEGVDRLLDCPVAIKLCRIPTKQSDFELLRERLKAISLLNHPNLTKVTYVDHFGPIVRIVTEYHGGGNLKTMIKKLDRIGLPLMLRLLSQVAAGVANAHRYGIIHGDLRPENIMIGHDQLIKIVDFAIQPWPVRSLPSTDASRTEIPVQLQDHEVQADLQQFAEVIEYLIQNTIVSPHLIQNMPGYDPLEELREVIARARAGSFSTIVQIQRILTQILERSLPGQS